MPHWKLKVKPNALLACYDVTRSASTQWRKRPSGRTHHLGELSPNACRKLRNSVKWMVACSNTKKSYEKSAGKYVFWKVNMATLTFRENMQDDRLARQILSKWLEMAKYRFDMQHYIWKAEPQERGAIHFHLITNVYIPHTELKYTWNRLLLKHGLNSIDDNSTDIHAVTNATKIEAYIADYLTTSDKHAGRRPITGRLWGCSHQLTQAGKDYLLIDSDELQTISEELKSIALETVCRSEGKPVPEFLTFNGYWITPKNFYNDLPDCELKQLYKTEIAKLKQHPTRKQLFPELN